MGRKIDTICVSGKVVKGEIIGVEEIELMGDGEKREREKGRERGREREKEG